MGSLMDPGHDHPRRSRSAYADDMDAYQEDIWAPPPSEVQPKIALLVSLGVSAVSAFLRWRKGRIERLQQSTAEPSDEASPTADNHSSAAPPVVDTDSAASAAETAERDQHAAAEPEPATALPGQHDGSAAQPNGPLPPEGNSGAAAPPMTDAALHADLELATAGSHGANGADSGMDSGAEAPPTSDVQPPSTCAAEQAAEQVVTAPTSEAASPFADAASAPVPIADATSSAAADEQNDQQRSESSAAVPPADAFSSAVSEALALTEHDSATVDNADNVSAVQTPELPEQPATDLPNGVALTEADLTDGMLGEDESCASEGVDLGAVSTLAAASNASAEVEQSAVDHTQSGAAEDGDDDRPSDWELATGTRPLDHPSTEQVASDSSSEPPEASATAMSEQPPPAGQAAADEQAPSRPAKEAAASFTAKPPMQQTDGGKTQQQQQQQQQTKKRKKKRKQQSATADETADAMATPQPSGKAAQAVQKPDKLHMVGSVPDMSAAWKAKVAVSDATQGDAAKLGAVYDSIASGFVEKGLDIAAVEPVRAYYRGLDEGHPQPLPYADFETSLQPGGVRLVVCLLDGAPELTGLAEEAARDMLGALPEGALCHASRRSDYHLTCFMTSQPSDPRPDPFEPDEGGLSGAMLPSGAVASPRPDVLRRELDAFRSIAESTLQPEFEAHSVVFASSGTLLLCCVEHSAALPGLRRHCRAAFPGAARKQSSIMHVTLGRVLTAEPLPAAVVATVSRKAAEWSAKVRGMRWSAPVLTHIQEESFSTVAGPRTALPWKS